MKKVVLVLAMLAMAVPAMARIDVGCAVDGNEVTVTYDVISPDTNVPRGFGLDIYLDCDANVTSVDVNDDDFWVFPGSIDINDDGTIDSNGSVVADSGVYADTLDGPPDSNGMTIEMGSLYPSGGDTPPSSGWLVKFYVDVAGSCTVVIEGNASRAGLVVEDTTATADPNYGTCSIESCSYPACWDYSGQCHADASGDGFVNTTDWPAFRDSFFKSYPDAGYNPCADYNRDGIVNTTDWPEFRDNFFTTPALDCATGDASGIYCP